MPGWFRGPSACVSRLKRVITSVYCAPSSCEGRMVLIATVRSITGSKPSYTTPIAPLPRVRRIWYFPSLFMRGGRLFVVFIDGPHGGLHQALHHRVQAHAALRALRDAQHAGVVGADFRLQFLVALRPLLRRPGVRDLVPHACQPRAG